MRLTVVQEYMTQKGIRYQYLEEDDCGSITFEHRGLHYHIWEYPAPERGAASNVLTAGRTVDYEGDYEAAIVEILRTW
jgi:hypothetical protein